PWGSANWAIVPGNYHLGLAVAPFPHLHFSVTGPVAPGRLHSPQTEEHPRGRRPFMRPATKIRAAVLLAAAIGCGFTYCVVPHHGARHARRPDPSRFMSERPSQWWFEQRSFPTGQIPVAEY